MRAIDVLQQRFDAHALRRVPVAVVHAGQCAEDGAGARAEQEARHRLGGRPDTRRRLAQQPVDHVGADRDPQAEGLVALQAAAAAQRGVVRIRIRV